MRSNRVDRLKFWAAICVVLLHANWLIDISPILNSVTVDGLFRIAVPVFAVISGYYLAAKPDERWTGWILNILVLYAFWMLVYLPLWVPADLSVQSLPGMVKTMVLGYHHLWYLPAIALAAFCLRFLARSRYADWLIAGLALLGVALQYAAAFTDAVPLFAYRNGLFFLLPMFALGVWLHSADRLQIKGWMVAAAVVAVIVESLVFASLSSAIHLDVPVSTFFAAPLLVLFTVQQSARKDIAPSKLYRLSDWIYLTHILFLSVFEMFVGPLSAAILTCVAAVAIGYLTLDLRAYLATRRIPV